MFGGTTTTLVERAAVASRRVERCAVDANKITTVMFLDQNVDSMIKHSGE